MKFCKNISKDKQEALLTQLLEYENNVQMTGEERELLHDWVSKGNSPYDNGDYICGENGFPVDFISASRFVYEQIQYFKTLTVEEQEEILKELRRDSISIDVFLQSI